MSPGWSRSKPLYAQLSSDELQFKEKPMSTQVLMPKLGFSMNEGTISEWLVADGGTVEEGQILYALESDKSIQEIEAPASGTLKVIAQAGETYEVGTLLAEIV
ncbi:Dihydrolipoyllysine-residue acetyltransferase component of pyruvate dehydrogenase complex [compost metagenome]